MFRILPVETMKMEKYTWNRAVVSGFTSNRKLLIFYLIGFLILLSIPVLSYHPSIIYSSTLQSSAQTIYKRAEKLQIVGISDPPCAWSINRSIYTCAGYCPWAPVKALRCSFLKRITNTHFEKNGMYCTPPSDSCLSWNAWSKEDFPLTLNPVRTIPTELSSNFTLNGLIPINYKFGFQFSNYSGSGLNWSVDYVNSYRSQVKQRQAFGTYGTTALYPVLDTYAQLAVQNKTCAVIGSEYPWIEAALLEFGARTVTTIEYNRIVTNVPNLFMITPNLYVAAQKNATDKTIQLFDSVWSYSSIEHDGLGRYTDPINPYDDLQTMTKISCMLKPGGLLFLAVPTNKYDAIHFNLHRLYGPIRLPLLYRYFHLVQVYGDQFPTDPNHYEWQPILVLQNKIGCE